MPRLDNTNFTVKKAYGLVQEKYTENPPDLPPIDLCNFCASYWPEHLCQVEHPDYDTGEYSCKECGGPLIQEWDG